MTKFTEDLHAGAALVSEPESFYCREEIIIAASQSVKANQVLGAVLGDTGAVTVGAPSFAGAGNGVLTNAAPAYGPTVKEGTYRVVCTTKIANGGTFDVLRPDGSVDGVATVGVAYDGEVKFTIADGTTDFNVGDGFSIVVTVADPADVAQFKVLDAAATDGAQHVSGVSIYPVTAPSTGPAKGSAWVRGPMELRAADLVWPDGITVDQKGAAIGELKALGIILR